MFRISSFLLFLIFLAVSTADAADKKPLKKFLKPQDKDQISFYGWGIFGEKGSNRDIGGNTRHHTGGGIYLNFGADYDVNLRKLRFGWYNRLSIGYGKPKYVPYNEELGFTGAFPLGHKQEVGFTYSFVGLYANSIIANFGSQFSLLYRYRFLQLELSKVGQGALKGCFVPTDKITNFSASLSFLLPKNFVVGCRVLKGYNNSHHINPYSEYRISVGKAF